MLNELWLNFKQLPFLSKFKENILDCYHVGGVRFGSVGLLDGDDYFVAHKVFVGDFRCVQTLAGVFAFVSVRFIKFISISIFVSNLLLLKLVSQ
jgi:hypothetical protein